MLHREERKTKKAKSWADGHKKTHEVRQDPSFKKRKGEVLHVADASSLLTAVPTNMGKIPDTKYVRNSAGASRGRKEDTDQDNSKDQMRKQHKLYLKDRLNFESQTEYSEYAAPFKQWEAAMGSVIETTANGAGEFARLQVTSPKVHLV